MLADDLLDDVRLPFTLPARLDSTTILLLGLLGLLAVAGALFRLGVIPWVLAWFNRLLLVFVRLGYAAWDKLLAWAPWPVYLGLSLALATAGAWRDAPPALAFACGAVLLFFGVVSTLAYIFVSLERYEVARGHKAIYQPQPGQLLAVHLIRHGPRVGVMLLATAAFGAVCGFSLVNLALARTVGNGWYKLTADVTVPDFWDFLAYTLLNLFRVADLLHVGHSFNVRLEVLLPAKWPASVLLVAFRTFVTVVLVQQITASFRQARLLSEHLDDFWSPHPVIHERARRALPQHGPGVVAPLVASLRRFPALTAEQRQSIPAILAEVGPAATPALRRFLRDPAPLVRGLAAAALGNLRAWPASRWLRPMAGDASEYVRYCVAEALGQIATLPLTRDEPTVGHLAHVRPHLWRRVQWGWRRFRARRQAHGWSAEVVALARLLDDAKEPVRKRAIQSLAAVGPDAAHTAGRLVALATAGDEEQRCLAADALSRVGGPIGPAVHTLGLLLLDASPAVKAAAAAALGRLGPAAADAVPALLQLLQSTDETVRTAAADAIGEIGPVDRDELHALSVGLSSTDSLVRVRTAEALGQLGEAAAGAAPELAAALRDRSDAVRAEAAEALGKLGEAAGGAVPGLVAALRDGDGWVSSLAAAALGEIGPAATGAVPDLVRALGHASPQVRASAAEALGKLGPAAKAAAAALGDRVADADDAVREHAITALRLVGAVPPAAWPGLLEATTDANPTVRGAALHTAVALAPRSHLSAELIERALGDTSDAVQLQALAVVADLDAPPARLVELTIGLLADDHPAVQRAAADAVGGFGEAALSAGPALERLALTADVAGREAALRSLVRLQPPEAAAAFVQGLRDVADDVRVMASAGLVALSPLPRDVLPAVQAALTDPCCQVRANAARAFTAWAELPADAVAALAACGQDADDGIRLNVGLALHADGSTTARAFCEQLLDDSNPRLQLLGAGALLGHDLSHNRAREALRAALADDNALLRRIATQRLHDLPDDAKDAFADAVAEQAEREGNGELRGRLQALLARWTPAVAEPASVA